MSEPTPIGTSVSTNDSGPADDSGSAGDPGTESDTVFEGDAGPAGDSGPGSDADSGDDSEIRWYLVGGVIAALVSLLILPIAGVVSVYCGYKLYENDRNLPGYLLAAIGAFSVVTWIGYLLTL